MGYLKQIKFVLGVCVCLGAGWGGVGWGGVGWGITQ